MGLSIEQFERNLEKGKVFESKAKKVLQKIFFNCIIKDTSEIGRLKGRKFPDFGVYRKGKLIYLFDAKCKHNYQSYVPISEEFVNDYLYHSRLLGVPMGIIFQVVNYKPFENDALLLPRLDEPPDRIKHYENKHGKHPSYQWNMFNMLRYEGALK